MMNKKKLTEKEQMLQVWDVEKVKDLMSRRTYLYNNEEREKELDELWVSEPEHMDTASFGKDWGYYVGMSEIRRYYIYAHNKKRIEVSRQLAEKVPQARDRLDFGCVYSNAVNTPYVVISGDGETAKGLFYSIGQETTRLGDGNVQALWLLNKIGADFVKENGEWKIWHIVISNDVFNPAAQSYTGAPIYYPEGENPLKEEFGDPTVSMLTHNEAFLWLDNYPFIPQPYETYTLEGGYGPWGHPDNKPVAGE